MIVAIIVVSRLTYIVRPIIMRQHHHKSPASAAHHHTSNARSKPSATTSAHSLPPSASAAAADPSGLGYAYHLPAGGLLMRWRNTLSQFSDLFSEFNRFIAPAYHHDRCERSVHMRLYSMHKREFVGIFVAFVTCFGLATLIGLAGPPITHTTEVSASALLSNTSAANDRAIMATGPFILRSPLMTTYSQQLWLIAKLETGNSDDERFDKSFQVSVTLEALMADHQPMPVRNGAVGGGGGGGANGAVTNNRTRHLVCERNSCDEFTLLHLGFLEYAHYIITVRFADLESFHQRYQIRELRFYVSVSIGWDILVCHNKCSIVCEFSSKRTIRPSRRSKYGFDSYFCCQRLS